MLPGPLWENAFSCSEPKYLASFVPPYKHWEKPLEKTVPQDFWPAPKEICELPVQADNLDTFIGAANF